MLSREEISERAGVKFGDASWETIKIVAPIIEAGAKKVLLMNNSFEQIDIPDSIFYSTEARQAGFTKRSFLEAGWRKITLG